MARIAGVDIPPNKKIGIAVTYIFGIGRSNGLDMLNKANVNPDIRVRNLIDRGGGWAHPRDCGLEGY
jgi:small subunit ribosomal protein S13